MKIKHKEARQLWKKLGDISIDNNDCITSPFLDFPKGTHREDIWHWFEEQYDISAHSLMFGKEN